MTDSMIVLAASADELGALVAALLGLGLIGSLAGIRWAFWLTNLNSPRRPRHRWLALVCLVGALLMVPITLMTAKCVEFYVGQESIDSMHGVSALLLSLLCIATGSMAATLWLMSRR